MDPLPRLRALEILRLPEEEGDQYLLRDPEGFSEEELVLSEAALFVAAHCDGSSTLDDVRSRFQERYGSRPEDVELRALVSRLDNAWLLETPAFSLRRETLLESFLEAPTRPVAHAGASYPADPATATSTLDEFFLAAESLEEPGPRPAGRLAGLVAPHIDLRVGGPATALAYREILGSPEIETVVVLGTAHACGEPDWIVTDKPYETPLGTVPVDREAATRLRDASGSPARAEFYHRREHSIEFQAIMLAGLRARGRDLRMVPVLCGSLRPLVIDEDGNLATSETMDPPTPRNTPFLAELRDLLAERPRSTLVIAAADLAHVGPRFGEADPLTGKELELLEVKDRETLGVVCTGEAEPFYRAVMEGGDPRRICGLSPIFGALTALPPCRGKLLRYEQATDPTGTVSYASVGLWQAD